MVLNQYVLPVPAINFLLIGMAFSTVFANMISEKQLAEIMKVMDPVIGISLIIAILNLGAPLDYHLIFGAGLYTAIYITARAIGKYSGAYLGASVTHAPQTVKKIFRVYVAAAFGSIAGVYRHRGLCTERPGAGVCFYHSRNDCSRSRLSMKSSLFLWQRKALNGQENCIRRKGIRDMTQRERQEHAKKTIFQAALAEFGAQPYETVTMDRICSRHGISKGMMYHYFSSKDELFLLCVKELFQSLQVYIQEESTQIQKENSHAAIRQYFMLRERFFAREPCMGSDF